jgi:hypothetical protein
MLQQVQANPVRIVATSGAFVMSAADGAVGLARTTTPAPSSTTLPSTGLFDGQVQSIEDLIGNFNTYPVTVSAPAGTNIAGMDEIVLNVPRQCAYFKWYADLNAWSVKL